MTATATANRAARRRGARHHLMPPWASRRPPTSLDTPGARDVGFAPAIPTWEIGNRDPHPHRRPRRRHDAVPPVLSHGAARCPGSRHPRDAALNDPSSFTTQAAERRLFHFPGHIERPHERQTTTARATPRKRGEGQWGLGYHEPLNTAEQIKKDDDGLNVRERIDRIFAPGGFRSIGKQDLRSPAALVRPLHAAQAGRARRAHRLRRAGGARGRVLHDADPDRRRAPHERAAARDRVGERALRARRRRHHRPAERAAALDPHRGRARDLRADRGGRAHDAGGVRRHAARVPRLPARRRHGRRGPGRHARHPRGRVRATWAIRRSRTCRASTRRRSAGAACIARTPRSTTSRSSASMHPTLGPGTTCRSAAACRRTRMFAQRLGAFVEPARVPEVWAGVTGLFREYGYRRSRNHARLKFLVKDWGAERVREVLEKEFLEAARCPTGRRPRRDRSPSATTSACTSSGTAACSWGSRRAQGVSRGTSSGWSPTSPIAFGDGQLAGDGAAEAGDPRRRSRPAPTSWSPRSTTLDLSRATQRVPQGDHGVHRHRVLQARDRRDEGPRDVADRASSRARLPGFDEEIRIHVNGCPNSCARFQVADIGLMSALQPRMDGTKLGRVPGPPGRRHGRGRARSAAR